jgi:hypothetical protein
VNRRTAVPPVCWPGVAVGAVAGLVLTVFFVLALADAIAPALATMPEGVAYGAALLVVAVLRAVAGMWAAMRHRARFAVADRTEFLSTAVVASLVGWVLYTGLTAAVAAVTDGAGPDWRSLGQLFWWVLEYVAGALLVAPVRAEIDPLWARRSRRVRG